MIQIIKISLITSCLFLFVTSITEETEKMMKPLMIEVSAENAGNTITKKTIRDYLKEYEEKNKSKIGDQLTARSYDMRYQSAQLDWTQEEERHNASLKIIYSQSNYDILAIFEGQKSSSDLNEPYKGELHNLTIYDQGWNDITEHVVPKDEIMNLLNTHKKDGEQNQLSVEFFVPEKNNAICLSYKGQQIALLVFNKKTKQFNLNKN